MAAITSTASGNWSATGTWTGSVVPGNGDTVTVSHAVTVDVNTTVGTSPSTTGGTPALLVDSSGTFTIGTGITLTVRGDLSLNSSSYNVDNFMIMNAGSSLIFDPTLASVRTTAGYRFYYASAVCNELKCNGSSGSHCTVKTLRTNGDEAQAAFLVHADCRGGINTATYTDFLDMGNAATWGVMSAAGDGGVSTWSLTNCTFTRCNYHAQFGNSNASDINFAFTDNYFSSSIVRTTYNASFYTEFSANPTTGVRVVARNFFDQGIYADGKVCTFSNNVIATTAAPSQIFFSVSSNWPDSTYMAGNLIVRTDDGNTATLIYGSQQDTYLVMNHTGDVHGMSIAGGFSTIVIKGFIAENTTSGGFGGMIFTDSGIIAPCAISITNSLLLPNPDGDGNELVANLNQSVNAVLTAEHNTVCGVNGQGGAFQVGESGQSSFAGTIASARANLCWSPTVTTNTFVIDDNATTKATNALVSPGAGYNAFWNGTTGSCTVNGSGTTPVGYDGFVITNGSLDTTHDVTISSDPFVDRTRNLVSWGTHKGVGSSSVANVLTYLANPANGALDTLLADLRSWVRAGFVPTASSLRATSYAGDTSTADADGNSWTGGAPGIGAMTAGAVAAAKGGPPFPSFATSPTKAVATGWV